MTLIELLVVIAILSIIMAMVGFVLVKSIDLKSTTENRLDDLIGGLAAGRLIERDLRHMPEYADPTVDNGLPLKAFWLAEATIDGKNDQPVLFLKTTPDLFDAHNGNTQYVRWFAKAGILYRETLNLTLPGGWTDLNTATEMDLAPFEVLRGVSWTVGYGVDAGGFDDYTRLDITAQIYPSMSTWSRVERQGLPPEQLAGNEQPRSVHFEYQISRMALADKRVQEGNLFP